ncbi:MAG: hypothetical protein ACTHON_09660, partial [Humibacter sp.]
MSTTADDPTTTSEPRSAGTTGQWLEAADGQRWWFDSGCLCLDFAYTGAMTQTGGMTQTGATTQAGAMTQTGAT